MRTTHSFLLAALLIGLPALAQQTPPAAPAAPRTEASAQQLEAAFKVMLTKATLSGRWCSLKDGKPGEEKSDQYSVVSASKVEGSKWVVNARIKYQQQEMVVPIPVEVKWAGDTAVLIVDKLQYPGGGTYSARVLFHEHTYAGTWSGGDHGGLLYGVITNEKN